LALKFQPDMGGNKKYGGMDVSDLEFVILLGVLRDAIEALSTRWQSNEIH